jgi:hypothetical protein
MLQPLSLRTRAALIGGSTALALAVGTGPAWADDPMPGSANDTVMTTGQALLVFAGIPLVVAALVYLLVSAPGWTRGGRADSTEAWTGEPLVLGAEEPQAVAPPIEQAAGHGEPAPGTGGTSASW